MEHHHGTLSNTRARVDFAGPRRWNENFGVRLAGADKSLLPEDHQTRKLR
jgi:hypothetical protein